MIEHKSSLTRGSFHYFEDGKEAGVMTYSVAGENKIIIDTQKSFRNSTEKELAKN
jgi:hypothetical protein